MTQAASAFLQKSRDLLTRDYRPKIERCLGALNEEDIWWRANNASNSIGNLVLHLCGNVTQWIIGGVGRRPFARERQQEFDERRPVPAAELQHRMRDVLERSDAVLAALGPDDLLTRRAIQGYDVTVLDAVYHVVEHFSMHTGQIILIAKARGGRDLRLWEPPD